MISLKFFRLYSSRLLTWRNPRILDSILSPKLNGCCYSSLISSSTFPTIAITSTSILSNSNRISFCNINSNLKSTYATKSTKNQTDFDKTVLTGVLKDRIIKSKSKYSTPPQQQQYEKQEQQKEPEKLGLFAKFKLMYRQYWYVLIPVHVITSIGWFGGFYYLSKSGVDIPSLLQTLHVSESIIEKLKGSEMGHIAVAYLCYKIATPARYAVTVGGTTISIKYLVQAGYIKPMPSRTELIRMYEEKKAKRKQEKEDKNK